MSRQETKEPTAVKSPALKYFGGKWNLSPWINDFLPSPVGHYDATGPVGSHFIVPYVGGASVFLRRDPAYLETINDIDGRVTNFFTVVRDRTAELVEAVTLTPFSADEMDITTLPTDDPVEAARRFFLLCWGSWRGGPVRNGYRWQVNLASRYASPAVEFAETGERLTAVAARLKGVQITNLDAIDFIAKHKDVGNVVGYCDPPYLKATREMDRGYLFESSVDHHRELAAVLNASAGYYAVSGRPSDLYRELFEDKGWVRLDTEAGTTAGDKQVDSIWLNPRLAETQAAELLLKGVNTMATVIREDLVDVFDFVLADPHKREQFTIKVGKYAGVIVGYVPPKKGQKTRFVSVLTMGKGLSDNDALEFVAALKQVYKGEMVGFKYERGLKEGPFTAVKISWRPEEK